MLLTHRYVQHRARAIVALALLAAVALVLAACGGGSDGGSGGSADAETLLRQTFTGTHDVRSGRAAVDLRIVAPGDASLRGPITASIAGPFERVGTDALPKFDLSLELHAQGQGFEAGLLSTSEKLFVEFGGTSYEVPAELMAQLERAQRQGSSQQQMSIRDLDLDPLSWLNDPKVEGAETVGGAETDHISAAVDVPALLDDVDKVLAKASAQGLPTGDQVPSRIPADARSQIEDAVKTATIDVWSGTEDHTLRRLALKLSLDLQGSDGPRAVDIALTIELTDLNQPQTIEAPATSRPLNELLGQLQGLFGGALGGAALGGGAGGASGSASSDQLDAYAACIQRAGSDVAAAQKCADLLTK